MATHNLAIAKASLAAGLMRSDPMPVPKEELKRFHELLDEVLEKGSPDNIQRCKEWLLSNQVLSTARAGVLGKYLVALSSDLKTQDKKRASSIRRQHLSILYLLNDLLHHLKYHAANQSRYQGFIEGVYRSLLDLLSHAATYEEKTFPRHRARIARLLQEWSTQRYFKLNLQQELEQTANKAALAGTTGFVDSTELVKREEPYIMPAVHGDPSAPYHELPAASLMPHIVPNTSIPIDPHHVRALQFPQGPAEPALVEVVKSFLKDIDLLYGTMIPEDEGISMELDDLGQKIIRDKQSGMVLSTETYYGWSKEFCENMKHKQSNQRRSQSRDGNSSHGRTSRSPRKRMRYGARDHSDNRQRNRSESYSRSRSTSRSRSRSLPRQDIGLRRQRSQSPPYLRSPSRGKPDPKPQPRPFQRSSKPFMSGSSPHPSPTIKMSTNQDHTAHNRPPISTQPPPFPQQAYPPMQQPVQHIPPPPPVAFGNNYHNNIPAHPPRPVNWQGPWPPPPPPPPPPGSIPAGQAYGQYQSQYQSGQQYPYGSHANAWSGGSSTSQPPPPPPPSIKPGNGHNEYSQQYNGGGAHSNQHGVGRGGNRW